MSLFSAGQMVVCVDASPGKITGRVELEKGRIYTIRGFCCLAHSSGDLGLFLEEVRLPPDDISHWDAETCFNHRRFRPVKTTSIEIFRTLVAPIDGGKVSA